jgi:steroid 5-alpha reductase family enzyme
MQLLITLLLATAALALLFSVTLQLARHWNNYGIVDVVWAYAFGPLALFYAATGSGWAPRRTVLALMVLIWSGRLGTHLFRRVKSHHPTEDARYQTLRQKWAADFARSMALFFQQQAFSVLLLGLPFLLIARNPTPALQPLEYVGLAIWLLALVGEAMADAQLAAFKRTVTQPGQVCMRGLWAYSRHPNYFFEWCVWLGYFVFACASDWGWTSLICPAGMLYLLLYVTGVPMAEAQSLRSRGDAYRTYQRRVSAFVPWWPRKP